MDSSLIKTIIVVMMENRSFDNLLGYLISVGSDISAKDSDGRSALHIAAQHGDSRMVVMLLEHGSSINAVDKMGWTPLDRSLKWGHSDAVAVLRARGGRTGSEIRSAH